MEDITFSDTIKSDSREAVTFSENVGTVAMTLEEYCKRFPDALECREYDV